MKDKIKDFGNQLSESDASKTRSLSLKNKT